MLLRGISLRLAVRLRLTGSTGPSRLLRLTSILLIGALAAATPRLNIRGPGRNGPRRYSSVGTTALIEGGALEVDLSLVIASAVLLRFLLILALRGFDLLQPLLLLLGVAGKQFRRAQRRARGSGLRD